MAAIVEFVAAAVLILLACIGFIFFISSILEKEKRASVFAGLQFLGMLTLIIVFFSLKEIGFFETNLGRGLLMAALVFAAAGVLSLIMRIGKNPKALLGTEGLIVGPVKRPDEREIVFARNRALRPGSEQYQRFYREHPEYEEYDSKRRLPGGISGRPGKIDAPHEIPNVAATLACHVISLSLSTPDRVKPKPPAAFKGKTSSLSPDDATKRVKGFARHLGADLVGITEIKPLWTYSHRGEIFHENWEDWGKEIVVNHRFAVVVATEMSFEMIGPSPHTPTSIESNCNYAKGAYIATQLAGFISNLGYSATANHHRHYEAVLVPLAVDAGLGELGRMGYLLTKEFGPRVRLAAVMTDLPLIPDKPIDIGIQDFCRVCQKCAVCCPSASIPMGDPKEVNGTMRWKLDAETCFDYWGKIGTGCNICMRVCPWSHTRTLPHKLIVELVSRNSLSRRLFNIMDDIFYGRKPKAKAAPKWAQFEAPNAS
jgi:reductive dehalogenase